MNFNFRIEDLELRSCNEELSSKGKHTTAEIVCWVGKKDKESCYTVAYWKKGSNENDIDSLEFVGNRFLSIRDYNIFMQLLIRGQNMLDMVDVKDLVTKLKDL